MQKVKAVFLVIIAAVLVDFAVENTAPLEVKLFKFALGQIPAFALAYGFLALGLVVGWTAHVLRVRRKRRQAAAAVAAAAVPSDSEEQVPQESH